MRQAQNERKQMNQRCLPSYSVAYLIYVAGLFVSICYDDINSQAHRLNNSKKKWGGGLQPDLALHPHHIQYSAIRQFE